MVNRVVLVGRLAKDPELKKTKGGVSFATFTVCVDNRLKNSDGKRDTLFINCTVFREQADSMAKSTRKGSKVAVDGSLNQRNFERNDGSKGKEIEIIVDSVTFLDPNPNRESNTADDTRFDDILAAPEQNTQSGSNLDPIDLPDDDLPF